MIYNAIGFGVFYFFPWNVRGLRPAPKGERRRRRRLREAMAAHIQTTTTPPPSASASDLWTNGFSPTWNRKKKKYNRQVVRRRRRRSEVSTARLLNRAGSMTCSVITVVYDHVRAVWTSEIVLHRDRPPRQDTRPGHNASSGCFRFPLFLQSRCATRNHRPCSTSSSLAVISTHTSK